MNWRRAMLILGLFIVVGLAVLTIEGVLHKRLVARCKTLQIGMTETQIIAVLGEPWARATYRRGELVFERLAFTGSLILPDVSARRMACEINTATGRAAKIVCDENFLLQDPEVDELDRRGIY